MKKYAPLLILAALIVGVASANAASSALSGPLLKQQDQVSRIPKSGSYLNPGQMR